MCSKGINDFCSQSHLSDIGNYRLCLLGVVGATPCLLRISSEVERGAVNSFVAGSIPAFAATIFI